MMRCPYCAEQIQDAAILCRFCKSRIAVAPSTRSGRASFLGQTAVILLLAVVAGGAYGYRAATTRRPEPAILSAASVAPVAPHPRREAIRAAPRRMAATKAQPTAQTAPTVSGDVTVALPARVSVIKATDVYVVPRATQDPLARIPVGVELAVLGSRDNWYLIQYDSQRWGTRRAYIHSEAVKAIESR